MNLLPFTRMALRSSLPPEEVAHRLRLAVRSEVFSLGRGPELFHGVVVDETFKIKRILGPFMRNSFVPVVIGEIRPMRTGTRIPLVMRPMTPVVVFMSIWITFALVGGVSVVVKAVSEGWLRHGRSGAVALAELACITLALPLVGYALMMFGFWTERRRAVRALCDSLGCEVEDDVGNAGA